MKHEDIKQFVGKNVRVYVNGGFHEGILYEDSESSYGSGFYMKSRIDYYVSKRQTQSRYSDIPCYLYIDGIKKIEEVNADDTIN